MNSLRLVFIGLLAFTSVHAAESYNWAPLETLAVQDRGRLKPFDSFAEETLQFVTGRRSWGGEAAEATVFGWMAAYEDKWASSKFILLDYKPLKIAIDVDADEKYFAPENLIGNQKLGAIIREGFKKAKENLSELEKRAAELSSRVGLVQAIVSGELWAIYPNPAGIDESWFPISSLTGQSDRVLPYATEKSQALSDGLRSLIKAYVENDVATFNSKLPEYTQFIKTQLTDKYPAETKLRQEVHYNKFRPFRWAWVLYTLGFLLLLAYIFSTKRALSIAGLTALGLGFGIHSYGFALRMFISGRPPVTNMYESVIWVSWGCMLFAALIWAKYKNSVILAAASVFSVVSLVLADNLPSILDPAINPLEPVLRSNFWLTIHVLTITLSYAAFALSLCLGNVVLGNYGLSPSRADRIQQYSLYMYRSMQIGVVLLAAGTILGGVWADYSWGRFWGWDPKEVWALIALLMYLAVLHGRFTNWLRGFGFSAVTVLSFLGVLMAWYGVNFVLGAGLHSYGFGTGGIAYVLVYIFVQLGFILFAYTRYAAAKRNGNIDSSIFPKGHR